MDKLNDHEKLILEDHLSKNRDYINTLRHAHQQDQAEIFKQIVIISVAVIGFNFIYTIERLDRMQELSVWLISNICLIAAIYLTLRFYSVRSSSQTLEIERVLEDNKKQRDAVEAKRRTLNILRHSVLWFFGTGIVLTFLLTIYRLFIGGT